MLKRFQRYVDHAKILHSFLLGWQILMRTMELTFCVVGVITT